jgi:outer membrane immunogenic protein
MKKTIFLAATLAAMATGATRAADIYAARPYAPPPPVVYIAQNWTGAYIGGNIGYQFGKSSVFNVDPSGLMGGVQAGYNWQFGQFVVGAETDFQFSGAEETFAAYKFSNPWFGTARARFGYALNNILFYGTGGLAYGRGQLEYFGITEQHTTSGWTIGAGLEVALTPHVSVRAEYLFVDLSATNYALTHLNSGIESSIVRFGLNYRF